MALPAAASNRHFWKAGVRLETPAGTVPFYRGPALTFNMLTPMFYESKYRSFRKSKSRFWIRAAIEALENRTLLSAVLTNIEVPGQGTVAFRSIHHCRQPGGVRHPERPNLPANV